MQHDKTQLVRSMPVKHSQEGFVLVTALLVMAILTIMGAAAMTIRNTEQNITSNSEVFQHNFYSLETVTLEGAAALEQLGTDADGDGVADDGVDFMNATTYPGWLKTADPLNSALNLSLNSNWPSGSIIPQNTSLTSTVTSVVPVDYVSDGTANGDRIWYAALDEGVKSGGSTTYDASGTTVQERLFDVYGMYDVKPGKSYNGKMMLQLGYKKQIEFVN